MLSSLNYNSNKINDITLTMTMQPPQAIVGIFTRRNGTAVRLRLQWLEFVLYWTGQVRREDLTRRWGISAPQASADIAAYQELTPGNLEYDFQLRCYRATPHMSPYFPESIDFEATLIDDSNSTGAASLLPLESIATPTPRYPVAIMRLIIECFQKKIPLEITYQDGQNKGGATPLGGQLTVCPHNLIRTASRTYLRCFVKEIRSFVNLVPARVRQAKIATTSSWMPDDLDEAWHTIEEIILIPSRRLPSTQHRVATELEFGLENERRVLVCRACMVYFQLVAMNLEVAVRNENEERGDPVHKNIGLAVENWQQLQRYCKVRV